MTRKIEIELHDEPPTVEEVPGYEVLHVILEDVGSGGRKFTYHDKEAAFSVRNLWNEGCYIAWFRLPDEAFTKQ